MKRSSKGGGRSGGHKRARAVLAGRHAFKVLLPDQLVASMVGKGGDEVAKLEDQSGAHLTFSRRHEYFPDTGLRILIVSAPEPKAVLRALELVLNRAQDLEQRKEARGDTDASESQFVNAAGEYSICVAITSRAAQAADLAILEESGARCEIDAETLGNHPGSHTVATLNGEKDQLMPALEHLNELVQEDVEQPWFAEWAEQRTFNSGDAEGSATSDRARNSKSRKESASSRSLETRGPPQCTIFVGGLSKSTVPATLKDYFGQYGEVREAVVKSDKEKRSKCFGFVTFAEPYMVNNCFDDPQDHIIDGRWIDVKHYEPDGSADAGGRSSADYRGGSSTGRGREEYSGHGHEDHRPDSADDDVRWFCEMAEEVPEDYFDHNYEITCTLPESSCGPLIGRRGENIKEVERSTGAQVQAEARVQGSEHRQFSITGPMLSVYAAHMLLMHNYNVAVEKQKEDERQKRAAREEERGRERDEEDVTIEELKRQMDSLHKQMQEMTERRSDRSRH